MKKKILILVVLTLSVVLTGCGKKDNKNAINFKNDYEEINGKENSSGKIHRTIEISKNNKFIEITPKELVEKIENNETFYVYFGSRLCPWCRSVIEKADEISRKNKIDKIYYIDIWDDLGTEIFRDKYEINEDGEIEEVFEGASEYKTIMNAIDEDLLRDYTLTDSDGNTVDVGEKRIYAPNFVYFKKGKAVRLVTGKSDKQTDSREELTDEMLEDETNTFNEFFK
jgi:thiol-disulfide isomerase/thioredoxin